MSFRISTFTGHYDGVSIRVTIKILFQLLTGANVLSLVWFPNILLLILKKVVSARGVFATEKQRKDFCNRTVVKNGYFSFSETGDKTWNGKKSGFCVEPSRKV